MSEKEKVLQQISDIKSHLIDRDTFFPYNYNACYVWSIIAMFLTLGMVSMYELSIVLGVISTAFLMIFGFIVEGRLTEKVNNDYDIDEFTKRQQFIKKFFFILTLFLILLSSVLATYKLYAVIYLSWLFFISLGYNILGFILNIQRFKIVSEFNMITALILLGIGAFFNLLIGSNTLFLTLLQGVLLLGLTALPAWVAWHQKKVECGV
jgi:hypothetical protein